MITTNGNRTVVQPHCFFSFLSANNASLPMEVFVVLYRKRQFWSVPHVNWDLWILHWKIESVLHVNWDLWILDWKIHDLVVPHSMRQLAYIEKRQDWIFPQTPTKNFSLVLHGRLRDWFAIKFKCHWHISTLYFIHYFIYLILTDFMSKIRCSMLRMKFTVAVTLGITWSVSVNVTLSIVRLVALSYRRRSLDQV